MDKNKKVISLNKLSILKDTRIIIFFSYLLLGIILLYISYRLYQNKRKPLVISAQTYALFETKSNLPENTFLDLGKTSYDKIKHETDTINSFKYCNEGEYVLDINSGLKRGASGDNKKLLYNPSYEMCTPPYSCPSSHPYAVQSTGETVLTTCEYEIPCRCITEKYCGPYVAQVLGLTGGNPWVKENSYMNFSITAIQNVNENGFTLDPLVIKAEDAPQQYCKINPAFTPRIENGCVFNINSGEPLDCESGSYLVKTNTSSAPYDIYYNDFPTAIFKDGSAYKPSQSQTVLRLYVGKTAYNPSHDDNKHSQTFITDLPTSGSLKVAGSGDVFRYKGIINNVTSESFTTTTTSDSGGQPVTTTNGPYSNIYSLLLNISWGGNPGLPPLESTAAGGQLTLHDIYFADCVNTALPADNYKNMLKCVQEDSQPCKIGQLAYNVDKGNPRNFAQISKGNPALNDPERTIKNYLIDPSKYTMSCVNGGGCSKTIDTALCTDGDCELAITEKKTRYYNLLDDSAISSLWLLGSDSTITGNGYIEKYTLLSDNKIQFDTTRSLLTLENGDYWSSFSDILNGYTNKEYPQGTSIFFMNDIEGITKKMNVNYQGMCSTGQYYEVEDIDIPTKKITLSNVSYTGVSMWTEFKFYNNLSDNDYGLVTNCSISDRGIQICTLTGLAGEQRRLGTSFINIYKQFGFNGINYNTTVDIQTPDIIRGYSKNSIINIGNTGTVDGSFYKEFSNKSPPFSFFNFYDANYGPGDYAKTFKDPFANFKNFKSMYYPVWNNNSFKQECIIPMPFLLAYPIMDTNSTANNSINRIPIQFSGRHFDQYAYYEGDFCYNTFSTLKKISKLTDLVSSNQYLVLDTPPPNIIPGNFIADNNCIFDIYFVQDKSFNNTTINSPSGISFSITIAEKGMSSAFTQLDDKYSTLTYQGTSYPDSNSYIIGNGGIYKFYNKNNNKNYFLGKVYSGESGGKMYYFNMKSNTVVENIDENLVVTNNSSIDILPNDTFIQFLDKTEKLEIGFSHNIDDISPGTGCSFRVNSITRGRITDIAIDDYGKGYLYENRPHVAVTKYKLKNN